MPDSSVLTATTSGQDSVGIGSNLVTQVARMVGGAAEAKIRAQALDCINRVRIELNQHDWRFMKTTADPITIVSGTDTYTLPSAFRKPSFARLVDSATEIPKFTLVYEDDVVLSMDQQDRDIDGQPTMYALRNDYADGYVTVFPIPDDATADDFKLSVEYYSRIAAIADSSDTISIPEEVQNVLVLGGQAYILRERDKASPTMPLAWADYQRAKNLLMVADRRIQAEDTRFKPRSTRTQFPFGQMGIRIV